MNFRLAVPGFRLLKTAVGSRQSAVMLLGCVTLARGLAAEGNSSLSESKIETAEAKVTAETLLSQNDQLRRQLSLDRESVKTLTESLAESNAEAELFRRKFSDLQLRMEALGLDSASEDRAKLEQRLLKAVSDLQLTQKQRDEYRDQIARLSEAILRLLQTSEGVDPQVRMDVEAQLRGTNELFGGTPGERGAVASLMDGNVISVKDEWSLVVGNVGSSHGVRLGMPMRIMRGDKVIATVRVVDVREKICGAVIQEMDSGKEKIKVGDRLQVDARQNASLK